MTNGEDTRERWLRESGQLDQFGAMLKKRIEDALRRVGMWGEIQCRTKSIDSILKKLLLKHQYTYDSLPDLVGVRVIVRYVHEVAKVSALVANILDCTAEDNKAVRLAVDGVGYLSIHREARLKAGDSDLIRFPAAQFRAEIQMRTLAQHLWSEMSHDTFYKANDDSVSPELKRRVNLMAGLLEVADNEFARLYKEVAELPDMLEIGILKRLESSYFHFASERGNPDLSLAVIHLLLPLYADPSRIGAELDEFIANRHDTIAEVFNQQREISQTRSVFMFQPEVLMLYERLEHDPVTVREQWARTFPERELERIALAFGISFD